MKMREKVILKTKEAVDEMIAGLNADQLRVFNNIKDTLTARKNNVPGAKVLRRFISGVGGVGKSHLIKLLRLWAKAYLEADVIVGAPTGIAAFNIEGLTMHRLFRLPVEHGSIPKYVPLSDEALQKLRNLFTNVILFILDEISMACHNALHIFTLDRNFQYVRNRGWLVRSSKFVSFWRFIAIATGESRFSICNFKSSRHFKAPQIIGCRYKLMGLITTN